jgi:translation initiation factor 5B
VQVSTLGSFKALLKFLKSLVIKIYLSGISFGPMHNQNVMHVGFLSNGDMWSKKVANETYVWIFTTNIIYQFFYQFIAYINWVSKEKYKDAYEEDVFPFVFTIMPKCVFHEKDLLVVNVDAIVGVTKVGSWNTSLCAFEMTLILTKLCPLKSTIN